MGRSMRVIIAGSRSFGDFDRLVKVVDRLTSRYTDVLVISGHAKGADRLGEEWARRWWWPMEVYHPDYERHGPRAPMVRNQEMVERATHAVFFWDGKSPGTKDCIHRAKKWCLKHKVILF